MSVFPKISGYTIKRILGTGGEATVYLAEQENMKRDVALKVMSVKNAQAGERFLREARIIARLTHPYIVPVYDVGKTEHDYFMSMEFLPNKDLAFQIKQGLKAGQILRVARSVASALDAAHKKAYIHRDVKPDNILFRDDGTPVLTDFGIAKPLTDNLAIAQIGEVVGVPYYMSPEQIRGEALDQSTDLYALGVVIYEMLMGKVPYEGRDAFDVGMKHLNAPIPRLPGSKAVFQHLLDSLMAKDKSERLQSAQQVIEALDAIHIVLRKQSKAKSGQVQGTDKTVPRPAIKEAPARQKAAPVMRADRHDRDIPVAVTAKNNYITIMLLILLPVLLLLGIYFAPYFASNTPLMTAHNMVKSFFTTTTVVDTRQQKIAQLFAQAEQAIIDAHYVYPISGSALEAYKKILVIDEFNQQARQGQEDLAQRLIAQAQQAIAEQNFSQAQLYLDQVRSISNHAAGLMAAQLQLKREEQAALTAQQEQGTADKAAQDAKAQAAKAAQAQARLAKAQREQAEQKKQEEAQAAQAMFTNIRVRGLLVKAQTHFTRGEYYSFAGDNALNTYAQALALDAENTQAVQGIEQTMAKITVEIDRLLTQNDKKKAQAIYAYCLSVLGEHASLAQYATEFVGR